MGALHLLVAGAPEGPAEGGPGFLGCPDDPLQRRLLVGLLALTLLALLLVLVRLLVRRVLRGLPYVEGRGLLSGWFGTPRL